MLKIHTKRLSGISEKRLSYSLSFPDKKNDKAIQFLRSPQSGVKIVSIQFRTYGHGFKKK